MSQADTYDFCPSCGSLIPFGRETCPECGRTAVRIGEERAWESRPDPRWRGPARSPRPGISGGLMLFMGVPALIFGFVLMGEMTLLIEMWEDELLAMGESIAGVVPLVNAMVYGPLVVGTLSCIGGLAAIRRRYWWLAMAGAIVLALGGLPLLLPGIVGIICVVLLYQSRAEFV